MLYCQIKKESYYHLLCLLNNKSDYPFNRLDGKATSSKDFYPYRYLKLYIESSYKTGMTLDQLSKDKLNFKLTGKPYEYSYDYAVSFEKSKYMTKNNKQRFFDKTKVDII